MSDVAKPDAQNAITHRNVDFLMRWHSFIQSPHSIIQPEGLKKKTKVNHSIGGVRGATGGGGQPRDNHGTTRGTTTGQPAGQPRDNHGTTTGQPRDKHGTTTGQPRDNHGTTAGQPRARIGHTTDTTDTPRHTEPRRALATRANPRPRSFASPRFARTHERNETISRLGVSQRTHPPNLRLLLLLLLFL